MSLDLAVEQIAVLNKGFVRLIKVGGDDKMIVNAARVSYGEDSKPLNTDAGLIDYLLENYHTSPFEMVEAWFHIKMPLFLARQWVRHRTASWNEISGRYSEMKDDYYMPQAGDLKKQHAQNNQGRNDEVIDEEWIQLRMMDDDQQLIHSHYKTHLEAGVSKEQARINLPLSLYTEFYWKIDLNNLMKTLRLRMDGHAQKEIRDYANAIYDLMLPYCPMAMESFRRHMLNAVKFSEDEHRWLIEIMMLDMTDFANQIEVWKRMGTDPTMRSAKDRKRIAFFNKLKIPVPTQA